MTDSVVTTRPVLARQSVHAPRLGRPRTGVWVRAGVEELRPGDVILATEFGERVPRVVHSVIHGRRVVFAADDDGKVEGPWSAEDPVVRGTMVWWPHLRGALAQH